MKNLKKTFRKSLLIIGLPLILTNYSEAQFGNYFAGFDAGLSNTGNEGTGVGYHALSNGNSGAGNTALGSSALTTNTSGSFNAAIGAGALYANISGYKNVALGVEALRLNTTGYESCAFGHQALYSNNRSGNSAFGASAMYSNTTGGDNNAFGYKGLYNNTTGEANCSFGSYGLISNTTGSHNTAIGHGSLFTNTTAWDNTATGFYALYGNKTGSGNTANGTQALKNDSTGSFNTATGNGAMYANKIGSSNVANGNQAIASNISGSNNVAVGDSSLYLSTTGSLNVAIGKRAGATRAVYTKCTFIGTDADASVSGKTNATAIGNGAKVNASNKVQIGNTAVTSIGGQVGFTTFSDLRLKENIKDSKLGLDFILNLRPVTYNYKDENQKGILYTGLIAQEVDAAAKKENVEFSGVDKTGEYWGIRYGDLSVPLIKSVQELSAQNEELKKALVEMQQQINALTGNSDKAKLSNSIATPQINIAPNPSHDVATITILSNDKMQNLVVKIVDATGKLIRTYNATTVSSSFEFNTSTLNKGTYMVQLFNQNELMKTEKLIVQ